MTTTLTRPQAAPNAVSDPALFLWTRAQYEKAVAQGVFTAADQIELIEGAIVQKMPQNPLHATALTLVQEALRSVFAAGHILRVQLPLSIGKRSQPEPDLAIVTGVPRDYLLAQPEADKAVMVVEISDATLRFDQGRKAMLYARAGIPEYWIVNLVERVLEVRRAPQDNGYAETQRLAADQSVTPLAAQDTQIAVADLLP